MVKFQCISQYIITKIKIKKRINTDEIAKERVKLRVSKGGHGIPEDTKNI
ncbi:hypothetical protein [Clostridium estertheticum]|nr:hypothetical protein [Clostridium estertheticum]MCB2308707.1 hypothetical protein [Clostridium estertheticum]MCB2347436.1 hypothetical protein [Clostridium estertheticum]